MSTEKARNLTELWKKLLLSVDHRIFVPKDQEDFAPKWFDNLLRNVSYEDIEGALNYIYNHKYWRQKVVYPRDLFYEWNRVVCAMVSSNEKKAKKD